MKYNHIRPYQVCKCCVMDTSDPDIQFDENGVCMRCNEYKERILPTWNHGKGHEKELQSLINKIKEDGKNKEYDCILGLSGGLDSSYMLHLAVKEWGLRPFVFHIDCGWNLPVAEENIRKICDKLGVHLHIQKLNWEELRQMQIAFFKSGLSNLDVPQDHAFIAQIDKYSEQLGIKYIMNGYNICSEVVADPAAWLSSGGQTSDPSFVKDVLKKNGNVKVKDYVWTSGIRHKFILPYIHGVKTLQPLNLVEFTKQSMIDTLIEEYGYVTYGQKHFEDLLTKFLEGWWAPKRFGCDIRRAQLSSLVVTGQMTREEALQILEQPPVSEEEGRKMFQEVAKRLEVSEEEMWSWFNLPKQSTVKYRSDAWMFNLGIKLYQFLGIDKRIR